MSYLKGHVLLKIGVFTCVFGIIRSKHVFFLFFFYQTRLSERITRNNEYKLQHLGGSHIYAPRHEKTCFAICEQQSHRLACASAQSDQRLCYSLP